MQRLIPLSARIWHMELDVDTDRPNLGYIRGDRFSLMFDCGASPAHVSAFLTLLQQHGLPKPAFAVLSHWHWDHAMGMAALSSLQIPVIASLRTNEILKEKAAWTWTEEAMQQRLQSGEEILFCDHYLRGEYRGDLAAIPGFRTADILFEGERTLDLGGVSCVLEEVENPHSGDGVLAFVPEERFLLLADSAGKDLYGVPWTFDPHDIEASDRAMEQIPYDPRRLAGYRLCLGSMDFTRCLKGHAPCCSREELFETLK